MTTTITQDHIEPQQILAPDGATVFAARAQRFEALAEDHALGDWLRFLGALSRAQHDALQAFPAVPLPDAAALARARSHGMPPLPAQSWPRDRAWQTALAALLDAAAATIPAGGRGAIEALRRAGPDQLEALATRVLRTELYGENAAQLPFVAAALQVYWTHMARGLGPATLDVPGVCPCCGFLPVASVVRIDAANPGLRYLHCALCNSEWNLVRVKCAACDRNGRIAYRQIDGSSGAVRAETCDDCMSYLKIFYRDKDARADPVADDLATLALDILMDEAGYARAGPNLLLVPGGG